MVGVADEIRLGVDLFALAVGLIVKFELCNGLTVGFTAGLREGVWLHVVSRLVEGSIGVEGGLAIASGLSDGSVTWGVGDSLKSIVGLLVTAIGIDLRQVSMGFKGVVIGEVISSGFGSKLTPVDMRTSIDESINLTYN